VPRSALKENCILYFSCRQEVGKMLHASSTPLSGEFSKEQEIGDDWFRIPRLHPGAHDAMQ
jgi:hypothetical protein